MIDLLPIQTGVHGGDQEGGHFHFRVAVGDDIAGNTPKVTQLQPLSGDLAPDRFHGGRWLGMGDTDVIPFVHVELLEGLLGQTQFIGGYQLIIIDNIEHGYNLLAIGDHRDLAQGLKAFGLVEPALAVQVSDIFVVGVNGYPAEFKWRLGFIILISHNYM